MTYLRDLERREAAARGASAGAEGAAAPKPTNFLAEYWAHPDRDESSLVVFRNADGIILLNRYPYVNGHLLVALGRPMPRLSEYAAQERAAFWQLVDIAVDLVERTLEPQGVNLGVNQGRAAGAGLPEHIHAHVLPRWNGDTNFMATVGQVRIIPDALESMWAAYRATAEATN